MSNRLSLKQAGAAALVTLAASTAPSMLRTFAPSSPAPDEWKAGFDAALAREPRLKGWQGVTTDRLEGEAKLVHGTWPKGFVGHFYRNGPARHERAGRRYHHWFDGDGMVQSFRVGDGAIRHLGRIVRTAKYEKEEAAGRHLMPAFGTAGPVIPIGGIDDLNAANINVLSHAGHFYALWEGGLAHELDPATLETMKPKVWRKDLKRAAFTAHPRVEPDGTLWSFGYDAIKGTLLLYHIAPNGVLQRTATLSLGTLGMIHDFVVTARHLVFAMTPYVVDPSKVGLDGTFLDAHEWRPELGTRVLAISKADLKIAAEWRLPPLFVFHFGNGFEEADGTIRFDYCPAPDATLVSDVLRYIMRGELRALPRSTTFARVTLKPGKREAIEENSNTIAEFPVVPDALIGRPYRYVYTLGLNETTRRDVFQALNLVRRVDLETGAAQVFDYGDGVFAEEHVFVAKPGATAEDDGWLIGTSLDYRAGVTRLSVFEAARLSDGPIVQAALPYALPLGFHGKFVRG